MRALNYSHTKREDSLDSLDRWSGSSIICVWTSVPEDASALTTSEYVNCKHWKYPKIKTICIIYVINFLEP